MSVLLITCELKQEGWDYKPFYDALKNNSDYWWHYLEATWIVETQKSPHEFANFLYPLMHKNDRLLIAKMVKEYQGWLPKEAWDWLNSKTF